MKQIFFTALLIQMSPAVVLKTTLQTQQHDQWCWSGTTTSVLQYYGHSVRQCDVANYTRNAVNADPSPFHNFGTTDCCADTTTFNFSTQEGSCNYWNYNWQNSGSIEDIFNHWSINNSRLNSAYSTTQIQNEINQGHPFIIRYGWTSGGGHFIVGRGYDASSQQMYLMDPWPGEGHKIVPYSTVVSAYDHNWTHTNVISKAPSNLSASFESSAALSSSSSNSISSSTSSSSSLITSGNCAGINNWNPSISYPNSNTQVIYNNILWVNQWWANAGDEPGVNTVWKNQGACILSSSSSNISSSAVVSSSFISSSSIASSSSVLSSSSVFINSSANQSSSSTNIVANLNNINLTLIDYSLFGIQWNQTVDYSYLYNANGILILENSQNNAFKFQSPLTPGFYFLKIQQNQQVQSWWLNIR